MNKTFLTLAISCLLTGSALGQSAQDFKDAYENLSIFQDAMATKLKPGIKKKQIEQLKDPALKQLALDLLNGKNDNQYKLASYKAYLSPNVLGNMLSIGDGYSKYENVTGVYLPKGKHIIIVDGIEEGKDVKLLVPNWMRKAPNPEEPTKDPKGWGIEKKEFELKNGVNIIELKDFGSLAYISYFSYEPEKEKPITVNF
ncbi:M60 family peptidase N-terminal accessory domain-containing protein [Sphingobacterium sp. CZ-2]|nr:M60 family peptidase N-terminal accessory domain-containing protein [Sphingobacterium sp. CZ-2]